MSAAASAAPALDARVLAEIARLAALPWCGYEAERAGAARMLNMSLREFDRAVYRRRGAAEPAHARQGG
jgi:hypothetical protein